MFFVSEARNLVTNVLESWRLNLYRRDRILGTTELVSTGMGLFPNATTTEYSVSADGSRAVFSVAASRSGIPEEGNVFLRDLGTGTTTLISRSVNGTGPAPGSSWDPHLSNDGNRVLFLSTSSELVDGPQTISQVSLYLYDVPTGSLRRIEEDLGFFLDYQASDDGRIVVFTRYGNLFIPDGARRVDLWVLETESGNLTQVTLSPTASEQIGRVAIPESFLLSGDGSRVAFFIGVPTTSRENMGLWSYDVVGKLSEQLVSNKPPEWAEGVSWSDDGRRLAIKSGAYGNPSPSQVQIWSLGAGLSTLDELTDAPTLYRAPAIQRVVLDPSGSHVLYETAEAVPEAGVLERGSGNVYLRELSTGKTRLVTEGESLVEEDFLKGGNAMAFHSAQRFDPEDDNGEGDIFYLPFDHEGPERVSVGLAAPERMGFGASRLDGGLSDDGRWIVFSSLAENLVPNDSNGRRDVLAHDRETGTNSLVSVNREGRSAVSGARWGRISRDGRSVLFLSDSPDLVEGVTNGTPNLFLRDLVTETTELVSLDPVTGKPLDLEVQNAWMTGDGRKVIMEMENYRVENGIGMWGPARLVVWSRAQGTTANVLEGLTNQFGFPLIHSFGSARFDRNASLVAFSSAYDPGTGAHVRNLATGELTRLPVRVGSLVVDLSADGRWVLTRFGPFTDYDPQLNDWVTTPRSYTVVDRATGMAGALELPSGMAVFTLRFTDDSQHLALMGQLAGGGGDAPRRQMFLYSLARRELTPVRTPGDGFPSGLEISKAQFSADTRWMILSSATSGVEGADGPDVINVFLHDRYAGVTRRISARADGLPGNGASLGGHLSADGTVFAFSTFAGDFIAGDDSRYSDVVWGASAFAAVLDSDGDELPDVWERGHFGTLSESGNGDPDHDGQSNREEYAAHTSPADSASRLAMAGLHSTIRGVEVDWHSHAGVTYQLQRSESLGAAGTWSDVGEPMTGYEGLLHQEVSGEAAGAFFRVAVTAQ